MAVILRNERGEIMACINPRCELILPIGPDNDADDVPTNASRILHEVLGMRMIDDRIASIYMERINGDTITICIAVIMPEDMYQFNTMGLSDVPSIGIKMIRPRVLLGSSCDRITTIILERLTEESIL
jgi:hypothetical protein